MTESIPDITLDGFLDAEALAWLRELGGDTFVGRMIDVYLEHVPSRLAAARRAAEEGNLDALAQIGNSLQSSAGNLGVIPVRQRALDLELHANQRHHDLARTALLHLEQAFSESRTLLEKLRPSP